MTPARSATPARSGARLSLATLWPALAAAFVLRVAAGLHQNVDGAEIQRGFDFYGFMADHVREGRGLVWAFYDGLGDKWANRAPLYPLVVAGARTAFGAASAAPVIVVQAAIGAAACLVAAALALRWGGTRAASCAAWIAALWPYSVVQDTSKVEHVVFAPLVGLTLLLTLDAASRESAGRGLAAGLAAGVATLGRLTFAATIPVLAAVVALQGGRRIRVAAFVSLGALLALAPWFVRNHSVTGAWTLGTDSGRALWVGNTEPLFRHYPAESVDESERELLRSQTTAEWSELRARNDDEVAQDGVFRGRALAAISARPAASAWGGLRKAAALWSPVLNPGPSDAVKMAVFGLFTAALFAAVLAAAATAPRLRADLPACLGVAASFTIWAAVFWGQSRYLAPLHGIGIALASTWVSRVTGGKNVA